jgi:hypothetical protein
MEPQEDQGGGNFLTRKYRGVPAWTILLGIVAIVFLFLKYKSNQQAKQQAATTPGTGTSTGTSAGLTSNLVGVQQPTPQLDGTYQVSISPESQPSPIYAQTPTAMTAASAQPAAGGLSGTDVTMANANSTAAVQPQTQSSSPQTQQSPVQ